MRHKDPELMNRISSFIGEYYREHHSTPSTRQIASAMGVSPSSGYKYLVAMDKAGMLKYEDGVITDLPKIEKTKTGSFSAPLVGSIRCGDPEMEEAQVEMYVNLGKGVHQSCISSPCLFNLFAEYSMRNAGLDEEIGRAHV